MDDVTDQLSNGPTQTMVPVEEPPVLPRTQITLSQLTENLGFVRSAVGDLHERVDDLHQQIRSQLLSARAKRLMESSVQLLDELAALGFAWRHIARMIGVSVPAVQKWRRGERMTPDNQDRLATLLAACDLIQDCFVVDVAAWFEIPIVPSVPVRPMDLYAADQLDLLLDWVSHQQTDPEKVLTLFDPGWRERYASEFEVFEADDGQLSLRRKDP